MSSVAEKNREAYNKKVKQSIEKTKKIKEKLANLKNKADRQKTMKEAGVKFSDDVNFRDRIQRVSAQLKDENTKAKEIKKEIKDAIKSEKYKIKSGDTLSRIAKDRGVTVAQIMAANPQIKDKNKIFAGRSINIPTAKVRAVSKTSDAPSAPPRAQRPVTLKSGKKGSIAQRLAEIDAEKGKKKLISSQKKLGMFSTGGGAGLKPVPAGNKGKGLSKLPTPVRNKMGFMYGGGMPMPSKKPRVSNTDYRKAARGMLVISIDMMKKKKGKGKGKKKS